MNLSTILDHIDNGHMALPEFQRGYVWNRDQVRDLMQSLYRRYPVGSLLVWATKSDGAVARGSSQLAPGVVKLLLDGQQRITSLYGIIRGKPPAFFDGNAQAFTGLYFHLESEEFAFYSTMRMEADPLWIDVSKLLKTGNDALGLHVAQLSLKPELALKIGRYVGHLSRLLGIRDTPLHIEEVTEEITGREKAIDIVVDIFNRVNSGGTKLSKGDLALARICAESPVARELMKSSLRKWWKAGYHFNLDWLLRVVNTITTGEAKFSAMHDLDAPTFENGLKRADKHVDLLLNAISGRLGLDHDRVFFGRYALPVMARHVDQLGGSLPDAVERDRLLYWYLQSAMWGRFSGSTESFLDRDLHLLEDGGLSSLIQELRVWRGGLTVAPAHFGGWSLGARFYPVLYLLTRVGQARDWASGLPLQAHLLGKMNQLEVHHIFPKAQLYKKGYRRADVNAVANFCFLTKDSNLQISATPPEKYFPQVETKYPGALASQWIPMDTALWSLDRYPDFLEERKRLLASAANSFLQSLLHEAAPTQAEDRPPEVYSAPASPGPVPDVMGGADSEEEEEALETLNEWVIAQGLPEGLCPCELIDELGETLAILDLAWPDGLQSGLSQPVAVLLNEGPELLALANAHGYRYFTAVSAFRDYVQREVLAMAEAS